jgi:hypothetical protein
MPKIEIQSFFYDLIHCKDKINSIFSKWDDLYENDERGALVAGVRESPEEEVVSFLMSVQRLAAGYEQIQELVARAEQADVDAALADEEEDDE